MSWIPDKSSWSPKDIILQHFRERRSGHANKAHQFYLASFLPCFSEKERERGRKNEDRKNAWWDDRERFEKKVQEGPRGDANGRKKKRERERKRKRGRKGAVYVWHGNFYFPGQKGALSCGRSFHPVLGMIKEQRKGEWRTHGCRRKRKRYERRHAKTLKLWTPAFQEVVYTRGNANNRGTTLVLTSSKPCATYARAGCGATLFFLLIFYLKYSIVRVCICLRKLRFINSQTHQTTWGKIIEVYRVIREEKP